MNRPLRAAVLAAVWFGALVFALFTYTLTNDQFGRLSAGWQIAHAGALPFRDYFDPGYFMPELLSAALFRLFGDQLAGELLLNTAFVATGAVIVLLLARRITPKPLAVTIVVVLTLVALPRAYDYEKTVFYPLGLLLAWRYAERQRTRDLCALAAGLVTGALFRYDTAVYLGACALAALFVVHRHELRLAAARAATLVALSLAFSVPALAWLQTHGGIADAADQAIAYGRRETARTRIDELPSFTRPEAILRVGLPPRVLPQVRVRWAAAVDEAGRRAATMRLGLVDERPFGPPERRTFAYGLTDSSGRAVVRVVNDPAVEDTDGINRATATLTDPVPLPLQWVQRIPVRLLPGGWSSHNAETLLFYICVLVPLAGAGVAWRRWRDWSDVDRARHVSLIVLAVLLDAFILRDPVVARVGGIAGPLALVGAAAMAGPALRPFFGSRVRRFLIATALAMTVVSLDIGLAWPRYIVQPFRHPIDRFANLRTYARPRNTDLLPKGNAAPLVDYLHTCTAPGDRVFLAWFAPELFFFAQRGFAGRIPYMFGEHWSEERFQRRSAAALATERTPIAMIGVGTEERFAAIYPLIASALETQYREAGVFPAEGGDGYRVFVRTDLRASGVDRHGLPCFAEPAGRD